MTNSKQSLSELREQIIHGLRMRGWSRIEAENEADERLSLRSRSPLEDNSNG